MTSARTTAPSNSVPSPGNAVVRNKPPAVQFQGAVGGGTTGTQSPTFKSGDPNNKQYVF
jgi:hypothetical protein